MGYTVDFKNQSDNEVLDFVKSYLGDEQYTKVIDIIKESSPSLFVMEFHLSFIGLQGYPVKVLHRNFSTNLAEK